MVSSKGIDGNKLSISKLNIFKCPESFKFFNFVTKSRVPFLPFGKTVLLRTFNISFANLNENESYYSYQPDDGLWYRPKYRIRKK